MLEIPPGVSLAALERFCVAAVALLATVFFALLAVWLMLLRVLLAALAMPFLVAGRRAADVGRQNA